MNIQEVIRDVMSCILVSFWKKLHDKELSTCYNLQNITYDNLLNSV